ncbi:MAG: amino acid adenylation domain-containing protein [Clostridiales bacterium]|jgi:amino acid adenylation domain-containing protein|nr:amino acid adenylation domain-containing protein [Clostridiales bacterium]
MQCLFEYLERSAKTWPGKTAFTDGESSLTFAETLSAAQSIGQALSHRYNREPIAVLMERSPQMIAAFFGVLHANCFYVPLDREMSNYRIRAILQQCEPKALIFDSATKGLAEELGFPGETLDYANISHNNPATQAIIKSDFAIDTDIAYIVYTSGSTGTPKGVAASHSNVIGYIDALSDILGADSQTVFGSQTPLYVDACLKEVYTTIKTGATTVLIPKKLFSQPVRLVEFLNAHKINTVCWVVSALTMISGFGTLDKLKPEFLHTVAFGSEVFQLPQFKLWREALPNARFINLYGPTETTGMCCHFEVKGVPETVIPIGKPFPNTDVFLVKDGKRVTEADVEGELYVRGSRVAAGYYRDTIRTSESFVQNPLHNDYPEIVYRTGDIAKYDGSGNLLYISRLDHQIKHMGYRIELAEIEAAASRAPGVAAVCCVYDKDRDRLSLYFTGQAEAKAVSKLLKGDLPRYMAPQSVVRLDEMPLTANGKTDRVRLLKECAKPDNIKNLA